MSKVILITGISSGFGKQTANLLAGQGHSVYGTIRNDCETGGSINVLKMDLTDTESIKKAVAAIIEREGKIDVLINNAGMHTGGSVETTPAEYMKLQIDTSFIGMVHLTREVLPYMRNEGGGMIINISSIGGLMGLPFQGFYSAAKFAVEGFSQAMRMEVKKWNIRVVVINPGDFHTNNSANRRKFLAPTGADDPYKEMFERSLAIIENDEANGWDPAKLASKIGKIVTLRNPRHRYVIGSFDQKLAVVLAKILPGKLFMSILADHYKVK
jgi:NAD(P)-dependent dehydrogenase (short-subunit alcohol dehydrogenase family)